MDWLIEKRNGKFLTQHEVAKRANISDIAYMNIECGSTLPNHKDAKKIASVLDFDWTLFYTSEIEAGRNNMDAQNNQPPELKPEEICKKAMNRAWQEMDSNKSCQATDCVAYTNAMLNLVEAMVAPFNPRCR